MTKRLTEQEIIAKLYDPEVPMGEILKYFVIDEERSEPFSPAYKLAPEFREDDITTESALGLNVLNRAARFRRQFQFRRDRSRRSSDIRLISNGDSWFIHPQITDVINHLYKKHLIYSLDGAGDELKNIVQEKELLRLISDLDAKGVLLSGGGNDLLGGGALVELLKNNSNGTKASDFIDDKALKSRVKTLIEHYKKYVSDILDAHSHTHVFIHGYDYALPVRRGRWLGKPMENIVPVGLQDDVISFLVDQFNEAQIGLVAKLTDKFGNRIHHVDVRRTVKQRWFDELHPDDDGCKSVADLFDEDISEAIRRKAYVSAEGLSLESNGRENGTSIPLGVPKLEELDPLPDHMMAEVEMTPNKTRRRQAELVNSGQAQQIFKGTERSEFHQPTDATLSIEVIVGNKDFQPARFLRDGAERAKAICRVVLGIGGFGSGSLLNGGYIFTNWHVLPNEAVAKTSVAEFGFEEGGTDKITVKLDPDTYFISDKARDFAIVACDMTNLQDIKPLSLSLTPNQFMVKDRINIIQHPQGRAKEVAFRDNEVLKIFQGVFNYRCDTEPGSSGSPVFNDSWELIGLHRAGSEAGQFNQAVRIDAIASFLDAHQGTGGPLASPEISNFVSGTSPHLGFFRRAGIIEEITPEVEIPTFAGNSEFADIGFWNIENFFGNVSEGRVKRIAKLLGDINMDALGLIEIGEANMKKLASRMRSNGENVDFVFLDTPNEQRDLAILFDKDTTTVEILTDVIDRHENLITETISGKRVFPRMPLIAKVTVENDDAESTTFVMIVVHLKSKAGGNKPLSRKRRARAAESLRIIADDIRDSLKLPVIIGGDYNEDLSNDVLSGLTDAPEFFTLTSNDEEDGAISFLNPRFASLIDHVVVAGDLKIGEIKGDDLAIVRFDQSISDFDELFSDHTPLVMRLVFHEERQVDLDTPATPTPASTTNEIQIPETAEKLTVLFD